MDSLTTRAQAAQARASGGVRSRADRPSQRRSSTGARGRTSPLGAQLRAEAPSAGEVVLAGVASTVDTGYEMWDWAGPYTETVAAGAFDATLAAIPDVILNVNHVGLPLARTASGTLELTAAPDLAMTARVDGSLEEVRRVVSGIERGDITEMSFAFRIVRGEWSPDYMAYTINEVDLDRGDVSVVTFGANPTTSVDAERAEHGPAAKRSRVGGRLLAGIGVADLDGELRALALRRR